MKLQFKDYFNEDFCLQIFPSFNIWQDADVHKEGYECMIFIGWLFFGIKIFLFNRDEARKEANKVLSWQVISVVNEARGESGWVVAKRYMPRSAVYYDTFVILGIMDDDTIRFTDFATPEERDAVYRSVETFIDGCTVYMWSSLSDAFIVRNLIRRAEGFKDKDKWELLSNLPEPCDTLCPSKAE